MKRITIAGGGLAGLSLGIALRRRGVPVELHEAGSYPRHRVCGEFISGVDGETLVELGIDDHLRDAQRLESSAWFRGGKQIFDVAMPAPAMGISRRCLDSRLSDAFEELGGVLHQRSRLKPSSDDGEVWTAGRRLHKAGKWLGLKLHVRGREPAADLEMHLGSHGYVGLARVEGGATNVCGLFRRREVTGRKGPDLLFAYLEANGLGALRQSLCAAEVDEASFLGVGNFQLGRQGRRRDGGCAIGDADRMIPPFTGNGMSMAFESALAAVEPIFDYASGGLTWSDAIVSIDRQLDSRFRRRLFAARALHPVLLSRGGGALLALAARGGLLPFKTFYRLLR
jgi:flavin-dependent dehydrogenase